MLNWELMKHPFNWLYVTAVAFVLFGILSMIFPGSTPQTTEQ
jgi:hypothetical protein